MNPADAERARVVDFIDRLGELSDEHVMWVLAAAQAERADRNATEPPARTWDPWAELRRREHLDLSWADFPAGARGVIVDTGAGRRLVVLHDALDDHTRAAVLTHELVHDERGVLPAAVPADVRAVEEAVVRRITRDRLTQ